MSHSTWNLVRSSVDGERARIKRRIVHMLLHLDDGYRLVENNPTLFAVRATEDYELPKCCTPDCPYEQKD